MKMKLLSILSLPLFFFGLNAQDNKCATLMPWEEPQAINNLSPAELEKMESAFYQDIKRFQSDDVVNASKKANLLRIPMVVHVIHSYGPENVTDESINALVKVLNDDFNARYPNKNIVFEEFQDILGNTEVEFRLAKLGPNGECVSGVNRVPVEDAYFSRYPDGRNQIEALKTQIHWPTDKYMNVYVVGSISASGGGRVLGYANFPPRNGPTTNDGFVTIYEGLTQHASTASHEIGHYLGLPHTWGGGNNPGTQNLCNTDDGVEDTPNTIGHASVCRSKATAVTCGTLDNTHNIMDYTSCAVNFTQGQSDVMRGSLLNFRTRLVSAENAVEVGADYDLSEAPEFLCTADFDANTRLPYCPGSVINFSEITTHDATSFNWTFEGGSPASSTERDPVVTYTEPGNFDVTLTVSDGDTSITISKEQFINIQDDNFFGNQYFENFESIDLSSTENFEFVNPDGDRTFTLTDEAGLESARSMYLQNRLVVSGRSDEIVSNTFDISQVEEPIISFDFAFAKRTANNNDNLEVYISQDCGVNYTRRKLFRADASEGSSSALSTAPEQSNGDFVPTDDQWQNYTVNINSFKSEGFKVKLVWTAGGGNNIYLDNFYVGSAQAVGVSENIADNALKLYPNPSKGQISIKSEAGTIEHVSVVNVYGKVVYSTQVGSAVANINLGNQTASGIYFAKVKTSKGLIKNMKFIVD